MPTVTEVLEVLWRYNEQTDEAILPPKHPDAVLLYHTTLRGVMIGTLAAGVAGAALGLRRGSIGPTALRFMPFGATGGGLVMFGAGYAKAQEAGEEGVADRALRLKYNGTQNRLDRFALAGTLVGAFVGEYRAIFRAAKTGGSRVPLTGYARGAAAGLLLFTATAIITSPLRERPE